MAITARHAITHHRTASPHPVPQGSAPRRVVPALLCALLAAMLLLLAGGCSSQRESALSALHYFQRGNAAYEAEDFPRAIEHYLKALEFDDEAPDIHYNLGLTYYRVDAWRRAVAEFQAATRLDPQFADAYLNLALAYDKLYNAPAAHEAYNRYRALSLHNGAPGNAPAATTRIQGGVPVSAPPPASRNSGPAPVDSLPRLGGASGGTTGSAGGAAAGAPGAGRRFQPVGNGAGGSAAVTPEDASNPFQGNGKWWTQDQAIRSQ